MSEKRYFDLVVIGGGPGGYVAAIKASQLNKKVALIEKDYLGGVCLNEGCIPTKTLIAHAQTLHIIRNASQFGIEVENIRFDYQKMKHRKDDVIHSIRKNLENLILSNKIEIIRGKAEFIEPKVLKIKGGDSGFIQADKIIIATGSIPAHIPHLACDHQTIFNSTSILEISDLPKSLGIIGGGYIGCEFASLFSELGVKVTILESLPSILISQGETISRALTAAFKKQNIDIRTGLKVEGIDNQGNQAIIKIDNHPPIEVDKVLVAIGRQIASKELGLERAGIEVGKQGQILVDIKMETNIPGVYAIGDVTGKSMLAHVASHQGIVAALNVAGEDSAMDYDVVPAVIFTRPEIATVGLTLEKALEKGYPACEGRFPFQALGKSIAIQETEGFVQVVMNQKTHQILGGQTVGYSASTLIAQIALAIKNELTAECLIETIHAHPTLPEAWVEAIFMALNQPLHLPPKKMK